jgi:hypothetical protein
VLAYVAGHTHENKLLACGQPQGCPGRAGWWEINTSAVADFPQQHRLVEVMDNRDGTLSLFGTLLNHGGRLDLPGSGAAASGFDNQVLAGLGLTFSFNDPARSTVAEGAPQDRNVELLLRDPRRSSAALARRLGRCALPTAKVRAKSVDRVRLGRSRRSVRRRFPGRSLRRQGRYMDRFCLVAGGNLRVGYPSTRVRRALGRSLRRRVRERAMVVITSSRLYRVARVSVGTRTRTLRRRIGRRRVLSTRIGKNRWYVRRGKSVTLVFKVRRGRVREVGVADRRLTKSRAGTRRLLKSFR